METLRIFELFETFGVETFITAFAVCLSVRAVRKIFPEMSEKTEITVRLALSVVFCLVYLLITKEQISLLFGKGLTAFGASYAVCRIFGTEKDPVKEIISLYFDGEDVEKIKAELTECKTAREAAEVLSARSEKIKEEDAERLGELVIALKSGG